MQHLGHDAERSECHTGGGVCVMFLFVCLQVGTPPIIAAWQAQLPWRWAPWATMVTPMATMWASTSVSRWAVLALSLSISSAGAASVLLSLHAGTGRYEGSIQLCCGGVHYASCVLHCVMACALTE